MNPADLGSSCPVPLEPETVRMAHGGGGRLSRDLVERVFRKAFANPALDSRHDSAVVEMGGARVAFTTDTYVVRPLFFPGGDIGRLAVVGTVNDLAVSGAVPRFLSAGFVLEEGLPIGILERVVRSMREAALSCGVEIVTGDTKVVDKGKGDGLYVNTAGIGLVPAGVDIHPLRVRPGDAVIVSGDLGRHGIAVLSVREGIAFESDVESDCASVFPLADALVRAGVDVHCLRDPTRGGLASVLNEIAADAGVSIEIEESAVPVSAPVSAACELLGLDPLYVACEGRLVAIVPGAQARVALERLRFLPEGAGAALIGQVSKGPAGQVTIRTTLGTRRVLDLLSGEQLPRIC
ncbi:MAG: hydrogenase expression/formation protein HypE [Planctomycetota bacterium]